MVLPTWGFEMITDGRNRSAYVYLGSSQEMELSAARKR
jgi:hypothetical protein